MKIAAAAYPLDALPDWAGYVAKLTSWVADAAGQGAELLVFPEYGAMELAHLGGPAVAADLEQALHEVARHRAAVDALHLTLAARHGVAYPWRLGPRVHHRPARQPCHALRAIRDRRPSGQADHDALRTRNLARGGRCGPAGV